MIEKSYSKDNQNCQLTFILPTEIVATDACICAEFTDWQPHAMEQDEHGRWIATFAVPAEASYQFRYLINENEWHNDSECDTYAPNPFGSDNSVVNT